VTSQTVRDHDAFASIRQTTPEELVTYGLQIGTEVVVSTYNEPLITAEWAAAIFKKAKAAGLYDGTRLERQCDPRSAGIPASVG
jgi:pyruvate formate lyase activating enzyme